MGQVINLMNSHERPRVGQGNVSVLGDLEASLLARWRSVLHEIGNENGEQTTEDQSLEDEISSDETQAEELDPPKADSGTAHVEEKKKTNKRGGNGTIPKIKKPAPKSAPNSKQSTP